eukprot:3821014-Rhodomonas_salina.1
MPLSLLALPTGRTRRGKGWSWMARREGGMEGVSESKSQVLTLYAFPASSPASCGDARSAASLPAPREYFAFIATHPMKLMANY